MNETQRTESRSTTRLRWIGAVTAAALFVGLVAAATSGVASAQTVVESAEPVELVERSRAFQANDDSADSEVSTAHDGISAEDEAVFERFDRCLEDAGIDFDAEFDGEGMGVDDSVWDAAFEQCDPILDELSAEFDAVFETEFGDISPEDEAVFDEFEQCLDAGGLDTLVGEDSADDAAIDALYEGCEQVLDGLSIEAQAFLENCPDAVESSDAVELEGADG